MTQPIGPSTPRYFDDPEPFAYREPPPDPSPPFESRTEPWGLTVCRNADTVIEGYLCGEPTVVSNACRTPKNSLDAYVCDEPRMKRLQDGIVHETLATLKSILLTLVLRKVAR